MSLRAALVAVTMAFLAGLIASLSLRHAAEPAPSGDVNEFRQARWRITSSFNTNLLPLGNNVRRLAEAVAAASAGRIRFEIFEPGQIVPTFRIVDAVRDGKLEAGYTWLGYDQGKLRASVLFGAVPFGMEPWEYTAWWYAGGGRELAEEIYGSYGVRPVLCGLIGPETAGWFRRDVETLDDLKGLKIRFAGLGGKVLQRTGASITMLPGGEIFQALEKGAIDAAEFSLPNIDAQLGFDRIAPINYFPGWHQPFTAFHLVIHPEPWEALGAPARATVELACAASVTWSFSEAEALQGPVLREFGERGVETRRLPEPILRELMRITDEVLDEEAAKDPDFERVLASQRQFSADYANWRRLAYLPLELRDAR